MSQCLLYHECKVCDARSAVLSEDQCAGDVWSLMSYDCDGSQHQGTAVDSIDTHA